MRPPSVEIMTHLVGKFLGNKCVERFVRYRFPTLSSHDVEDVSNSAFEALFVAGIKGRIMILRGVPCIPAIGPHAENTAKRYAYQSGFYVAKGLYQRRFSRREQGFTSDIENIRPNRLIRTEPISDDWLFQEYDRVCDSIARTLSHVELYVYEKTKLGHTQTEIGECIETSRNNVAAILQRAKIKIARLISEMVGVEIDVAEYLVERIIKDGRRNPR